MNLLQEAVSNPSRFAQFAKESYTKEGERTPQIGNFVLQPDLSGKKTAVYKRDDAIIVSHRGTDPKDVEDVASDARMARGGEPLNARMARARYRAAEVNKKLPDLPTLHTGHSLGGFVSREIAREEGDVTVGFNRYAGVRQSKRGANYDVQCKSSNPPAFCGKAVDFYNPRDVATLVSRRDYGKKIKAGKPSFNPLKNHSLDQFIGSGKNKHPQAKLMEAALKTIKNTSTLH